MLKEWKRYGAINYAASHKTMHEEFTDKVILVTGGTGTIGSGLTRRIFDYEPRQVRVLSRDETKQYMLLENLGYPERLRLLIGDIRDRERLELSFKGVDVVFHAAALKHVPFCEYNPFETVKTNIIGSQNVIDAALRADVRKVVAISTDKVVNPAGVMGVSKLMMEKLFINANYYKGDMATIFSCVRFGNVLWTRGSVLALWKEQVERNGVISVTNEEMTRFMMSQEEAINLIFAATKIMRGGEIFIFKMPSIRIIDLAKLFINKYYPERTIGITIAHNRGGEKLHEELLECNGATIRIFENEKMFIVVPQVYIYGSRQKHLEYQGFREISRADIYSSKDHINADQIAEII